MSLTIMGVHRQLCFQMTLGSYGASVSPGGGFSASVEGSLLIGDTAVGETDAVSPCVFEYPSAVDKHEHRQRSTVHVLSCCWMLLQFLCM